MNTGNENLKRLSIKELKEKCQNIPSEVVQTKAGKISRFFSIYLTRIFIRTKVTPNQLTFAGSVIYLVGVFLFSFNVNLLNFFAFILMLFATLIDACDGEVHRFRGYKGGYGASYVEPISHDIMYGLMFMPIGFGAYLKTGNILFLLCGATASIFKLLFRMTQVRFFYGVIKLLPEKGHIDNTKKLIEHSGIAKSFYSFYRNIATSSGLHVFLLIAVIFNRLDVFIFVYSIIFVCFWLGLFGRQIMRFRKISKQIKTE